jgi:superfamily I DNA/RNA helicase
MVRPRTGVGWAMDERRGADSVAMRTSDAVYERLARLTPDQRVAATAPPGPVLCVAPAGSGKTTTLVARIAWLVDGGVEPGAVTAITFNKRAADELRERLDQALAPLGLSPGSVRVRTFHALGREILRDAGAAVDRLVDRALIIRELWPTTTRAELARLDTAFSRLKLEHGVAADDVAGDPGAGPLARAFVAYERALAARDAIDFDDLIRRSLGLLGRDDALLDRWRTRCAHLLVDEVQDVDRSQLRLALLLAAPANRIFLVGDDDQSIYGWRLADVRRVLELEAVLPGLQRVDLEVNHRCPMPVVERAVRLVAHNRERFEKRIRPRAATTGRLVLAPDPGEEPGRTLRLLASWPDDDGTRAVLARTNRELRPAVVAALELGLPFRAADLPSLVDDPRVDLLLDLLVRETDPRLPLLVRLGRLRGASPGVRAVAIANGSGGVDATWDAGVTDDEEDLLAAVLGWAVPYTDSTAFRYAILQTRARLADLCRDDARLVLATAHSTKGLEFDHVAVIGMDEGRFPSGRAVREAPEPARALEEERRLAYVAWTRARRTLTLSYDPSSPSPFLLEAFTPAELGMVGTMST